MERITYLDYLALPWSFASPYPQRTPITVSSFPFFVCRQLSRVALVSLLPASDSRLACPTFSDCSMIARLVYRRAVRHPLYARRFLYPTTRPTTVAPGIHRLILIYDIYEEIKILPKIEC